MQEFEVEEKKFEYLKGTTTVGLVCRDGVVLGTDSRASAGYEIASKTAKKLYQITDHIGVTVAGSVGDTQALVRNMRAEARYYERREDTPISVSGAAKLSANLFKSAGFFPYLAVFIMAGYDRSGPGMYLLNMDGSLIEEKMVATGSGSPMAYGLLEDRYEEDLVVDEAVETAVDALSSAIERDIATGNEIRVATLTEEGFERVSEEEIQKITG
ncbi:MAG: archaeal proteasome endopeptidase complex subunit beta [Candidatus Hadarchaeia archaeon]